MTKMAAMPIYGKNLKTSSSPEPKKKKTMTLKLDMQNKVLEYYHVCLNDDPGLTKTYFKAMSNKDPCFFLYGKKGETIVFLFFFQKLL